MIKQNLLIYLILTLSLLILSPNNVLSLTEEWKHSMDGAIEWVYSDDLDNDGKVEILTHAFIDMGVGGYSVIYVFDKSGKLTGKIGTDARIFDIQVMDFDRDGEKEIITATGGLENNDPDNPYGAIKIFNKKGEEKLKYDVFSQFRSVYSTDIDDDSRNEILAASGYERVTKITQNCFCDVYLINRRLELTWKFKAQEDRFGIEEYLHVYAEDLDNAGDSDNKKHKEIITSTSAGRIYVLNSDGTSRWNYSLDGIADVYAADIDNPEDLRKLSNYTCDINSCSETCNASCREAIASSAAGTVYVFNSNGKLRWSYETGSEIVDTLVYDLDNDGNKEIIVGSDEIYVLDNNGKLLWKYKTKRKVFSIYAADLNNDNINDVISGADSGIYILGDDGELYENYDVMNVKSVYAKDVDNDNTKEIIAGIGADLYVFKVDKANLYRHGADRYYKTADDYYKKEDYNNALIYANDSYNYYVLADDGAGISKSNELISSIEKEIYTKLKEDEAGKYLSSAKFYYYNLSDKVSITNCTEIDKSFTSVPPAVCAKEYAKKAREIYLELGLKNMVSQTDPMIPESERGGGVNKTTNETNETTIPPTEEPPAEPEEKGLIGRIISRELNLFGIPVLYIIIGVVLIVGIFILPDFTGKAEIAAAEPLNLAVLGAAWGEDVRAHLFVSFRLGLRDPVTGRILDIGGMASGLKDDQINEITKNLKPLITEELGNEVRVKPEIVVEVTYKKIQKSSSYASGYELISPSLVRIRGDMSAGAIDTLDRVAQLTGAKK